MNRITSLLFVTALLAFSTSCEKCATCTTISDDPATDGEVITKDVCASGRDYDDQLEIYTGSGWECTEEAE